MFAVLAALAAGVVAKDDDQVTTDLFLVGFETQKLVASVITSDASATTFSVACADSVKTADCELPTSFTFTQGPSTMHYKFSHSPTADKDPARTVEVGCVITADHGTCSKSIEATLGTFTSTAASATTTFTSGGSELGGQVVTVTAGNLVIPSSTTSTTSKSSSVTAVSTMTVVPQESSASPTTTSATSTDAAFFEATKSIEVATTSSTGGAMPMITGNANWVIGGAAAMVALAAL
ncbi:hypothetical protein B0O99DRAFT_688652 [Bisporella sp. PMI_857]|nr:hypothetical protein B0O99DRAFT_688652 [Bisporella sp. PMI_857]